MAKVYGMHLLRLREGVNEAEFETFMAESLPRISKLMGLQEAGWKPYLLKGERGERAGKYMWLWEVESVEALTRLAPTPETSTEEWKQLAEARAEELRKWEEQFAVFTPCKLTENTIFTDYVVVAG